MPEVLQCKRSEKATFYYLQKVGFRVLISIDHFVFDNIDIEEVLVISYYPIVVVMHSNFSIVAINFVIALATVDTVVVSTDQVVTVQVGLEEVKGFLHFQLVLVCLCSICGTIDFHKCLVVFMVGHSHCFLHSLEIVVISGTASIEAVNLMSMMNRHQLDIDHNKHQWFGAKLQDLDAFGDKMKEWYLFEQVCFLSFDTQLVILCGLQ